MRYRCNFNKKGGQATATYIFNTGFYGLTILPAEFRKAIDKTLYNLTNTFSFLEDTIIVTGGGIENQKKHLFNCLDRLNDENLAINIDKCHFAKDKITWLGYEVTEKGIKPIVSKTQAILNLKPPTTHKQLKSFLGSVQHLIKFLPNLATLCQKYRDLLQNETKYIWTEKHQSNFRNKKTTLGTWPTIHTMILKGTQQSKKTRVKTEHDTCRGWETILYTSRFLINAEKNYSIYELELLGVVWALEHFRNYLLGHHFTVQTIEHFYRSLENEQIKFTKVV